MVCLPLACVCACEQFMQGRPTTIIKPKYIIYLFQVPIQMIISWAVQAKSKGTMSNSEDSQQYLTDMMVKDEDEASGGE